MEAFERVLFIDDDIIAIKIYVRLMQVTGFCNETISCSNGQQAKDFLEENVNALPDVIFLDINMHIMTGWQFLEWYNEWAIIKNIDIPVYVVSSSMSRDDADRAKNFKSVKGYISKPISQANLKNIALHKI